jgi:hypothetical protein
MPEVRPGTALEDAQRRDFACNALFYNLQTELVEDYCGGLADLKQGVLRCPLSPYETFMDDPLRILRGVRFAGQLGFELHGSIDDALLGPQKPTDMPYPFSSDAGALHPLVHALIHKVSRERAAIELSKAFGGPHPARAVHNVARLGLLHTSILVEAHFSEKPKSKIAKPDIVMPMIRDPSAVLLESIEVNLKLLQDELCVAPVVGSSERIVVSLVAVLDPVLRTQDPVSMTAQSIAARVDGVLVRWLKLPTKVAEATKCIISASQFLSSHVVDLMRAAESCSGDATMIFTGDVRAAVFGALKLLSIEPRAVAPLWAVSAAVALALRSVVIDCDIAEATRRIVACIGQDSDGALLNSPIATPVIRGDQLSQHITIARQDTGKALDAQREFMLHNPGCTAVDVAAFLVQKFGTRA